MAVVSSPEEARRFVAYWASEGATWIKAYTDISRAELGAAIKEAHKRGIKVTGHLCSVSFREAVALGIDNLEHGMLTASDFESAEAARRLSRQHVRRQQQGQRRRRDRRFGHRPHGEGQGADDLHAGGVSSRSCPIVRPGSRAC